MIDYENTDLAVVKALSKAALTLDEIEEILSADKKYFMVDQKLDFVQASEVKRWARNELNRHRAISVGKAKSLEEMEELEEGLGIPKI